ncbi:MAG: DEAD/DEAH box helicase [Mangrovibacterium sp.]
MQVKEDFLFDSYNNLSFWLKQIVDYIVIKFTGLEKYMCFQTLQRNLNPNMTQKEFRGMMEMLLAKRLVFLDPVKDVYDVPDWLKLKLFPVLLKDPMATDLLIFICEDEERGWEQSPEKYIRDYLSAAFCGESQYSRAAEEYLKSAFIGDFMQMRKIFVLPEYDQAMTRSARLFHIFLHVLISQGCIYLEDFGMISRFYDRNPSFKGLYNQRECLQSEILFHQGRLAEGGALIRELNTNSSLLLQGMADLFLGDFALSVENTDRARVTDETGQKMARIDLSFYHEFFYWLNFAFIADRIDVQRLNSFIRKAEKNGNDSYNVILPLLYFLAKDPVKAKQALNQLSLRLPASSEGTILNFFYCLTEYVIEGSLKPITKSLSLRVFGKLNANGQWLFLRELCFVMERSKLEHPSWSCPVPVDDIPCLMSRLQFQEPWEQVLNGLLQIGRSADGTARKEQKQSRLCYLVDFDDRIIQPVIQTYTEKAGWSAGRNVSLKRFKPGAVEGMTEQDQRVTGTLTTYGGYYGPPELCFDYEKAMEELCGHPLLFLLSNRNVAVELIKSGPVIYTEKVKGGAVRLRTDITEEPAGIILIRETQTRYRLVSLTPSQRSVIRLIQEGVSVPAEGKEKLLKAISSLSGVMTVHSELTDTTTSLRTVEPDSRIRVQIVPIGDGLKAEFFIKPLGEQPPYVKPGKGGKTIYGRMNEENCQSSRNLSLERENAAILNNALAVFTEADLTEDSVHFTDPYDCLQLLEVVHRYQDIAVLEWPEGERFRMKKHASFETLKLRVKGKGQWFELDGELTVDEDTVIGLKELLQLSRKSRGRFVELSGGEFLALTEELKKQLSELDAFVKEEKDSVLINRFSSHILDGIIQMAGSVRTDRSWKDFKKQLEQAGQEEVKIPAGLNAELRSYQEEGFRWMARLQEWGAGACLADDMGLGKTVQAIAMLLHLAGRGPALVVCPASVVANWHGELQRFAPSLNPVLLKPGNRENTFSELGPSDVLVMTYGLLQTEVGQVSQINWSAAVLDEAHAIKNVHTKSSKAAMHIQSGFKLTLTGTPVQNNLGELWNLFNFCNPGLLGSFPHFTERFVKNDSAVQRGYLKKLITPFILRRTKGKVLDELPPKTEITYHVNLSDEEMAFYEALRQEAIQSLEGMEGTNGQQHLRALAEITRLRLACCNTSLVNKNIHLPSAKLASFFDITGELLEGGHRALVFSQFVVHLDIVRKELDKRGISYQYLDGSTPLAERTEAVKAFQSGKGDLFLISLKAGGLGLNLTAADYVLHLDPWWNPAIEDQASDRAHRIGQSRPVTIYRLVAQHTIEDKIVRLHATKRDMAESLLEGADQSARLSVADLIDLLKEG